MMNAAVGMSIAMALLTLTSGQAFCAEVHTYTSDAGKAKSVVIEGEIVKGDYARFVKQIKGHRGKIGTVYIFSSGGDFSEAVRIGRAIRRLELTTVIPSQSEDGQPLCDAFKTVPKDYDCICAGSCFFVFVGGVNREGGYVVIHRPYLDKNESGHSSGKDTRNKFIDRQRSARRYMQEMGVPKDVQERILGTQPRKAVKLDFKTVRAYFHGDVPSRRELLQAKCAQLERDKIIHDCYGAVDKERRIAAYEKFFGK